MQDLKQQGVEQAGFFQYRRWPLSTQPAGRVARKDRVVSIPDTLVVTSETG
jgi:hypothetical protein